MKKIIFDTNMLYNYLSLRENTFCKDELQKIIETNDCYITSVSIIEAFSYYKNKPDELRKIINTLGTEFILLNIELYPHKGNYLDNNIKKMSDEELSNLANIYHDRKIQEESEFIYFFFYNILSIVIMNSFDFLYDKKNISCNSINLYANKMLILLKSNKEFFLNNFKSMLQDAYNSNNPKPQKDCKNFFALSKKLMEKLIGFYLVEATLDVNCSELDINQSNELIKLIETIWVKFLKSSCKNIEYEVLLHEAMCQDLRFKNYPTVKEYFLILIKRVLLKDAKFMVNDISDMNILYALDELPESLLLTHDERYKKFLISKNRYYDIPSA